MRAEDVAASVLDVAFTKDAPQALNVVNPQRASWTDIMTFIRDAIVKQTSLRNDHLTMIPFVDWVIRLENKAKDTSPEDLANIVSVTPSYLSGLAKKVCAC